MYRPAGCQYCDLSAHFRAASLASGIRFRTQRERHRAYHSPRRAFLPLALLTLVRRFRLRWDVGAGRAQRPPPWAELAHVRRTQTHSPFRLKRGADPLPLPGWRLQLLRTERWKAGNWKSVSLHSPLPRPANCYQQGCLTPEGEVTLYVFHGIDELDLSSVRLDSGSVAKLVNGPRPRRRRCRHPHRSSQHPAPAPPASKPISIQCSYLQPAPYELYCCISASLHATW